MPMMQDTINLRYVCHVCIGLLNLPSRNSAWNLGKPWSSQRVLADSRGREMVFAGYLGLHRLNISVPSCNQYNALSYINFGALCET